MPTQTADRNSTARPATMKGRHCCANNPEGDVNRVADISNSEVITTVKKQNDISQSSKYWGAGNILLFENTMVDDYGEGKQAPLIGLAHEIDHASISIPAWDVADSYGQMNADANADAFMLKEDCRYDSWEQKAVGYENFIGNKIVNGNKLATYHRNQYEVPERMTLKPVKSIFSIK